MMMAVMQRVSKNIQNHQIIGSFEMKIFSLSSSLTVMKVYQFHLSRVE